MSKRVTALLSVLVLLIGGITGCTDGNSNGDLVKNESTGELEVETPYCDLHMQEKWDDFMKIEVIENEEYCVRFFGVVDSDEVELFDIVFSEEEGFGIGTMKTDEGKDINIDIIFYEIEANDNWNDTTQDSLYKIQEEINYIITRLSDENNFEYY